MVVSFLVAVASILFSQAFPQEASGWAPATDALISAFDRADVIVLGEGHGRKADSDFRVAFVRNPKFVDAVRVIVLEARQPELSAAVEQVNEGLPPARRIEIVLNQTPQGCDRNATAVALVHEYALDKRQKALVVFGSGHVWRRVGGVTKLLEQRIPGRVLVVETIAPVDPRRASPEGLTQFVAACRALEATLRTRTWPYCRAAQVSGGQVRGRSVLCGTGEVGPAGQTWRSCCVFRRSSMRLPALTMLCQRNSVQDRVCCRRGINRFRQFGADPSRVPRGSTDVVPGKMRSDTEST